MLDPLRMGAVVFFMAGPASSTQILVILYQHELCEIILPGLETLFTFEGGTLDPIGMVTAGFIGSV